MFTHRFSKTLQLPLVVLATATFSLAWQTSRASAQTGDFDFEEQGPKVEDDAWYDVSEWFDGNDYNPTDEAIGRWDDEIWSYHDAITSNDEDNDEPIIDAKTFYGDDYSENHESYVDQDKDGIYERSGRYVDSDGDYLNDAYVTYEDRDDDGMYDTYQYSELGHKPKSAVHPKRVAQNVAEGLSGKRHKLDGVVTERKGVVRSNEVLVLMKVKGDGGEEMWVDLGTKHASLQLFKGDKATFYGPITKRGDKSVLLATEVHIDGLGALELKREGRRFNGVVQSTRTAKVRGETHLVVKLKTDNGKMVTVDFGLADARKTPKEGEHMSVTGVAVNVGDRVILVADQNAS
jgi:hypothetical protein